MNTSPFKTPEVWEDTSNKDRVLAIQYLQIHAPHPSGAKDFKTAIEVSKHIQKEFNMPAEGAAQLMNDFWRFPGWTLEIFRMISDPNYKPVAPIVPVADEFANASVLGATIAGRLAAYGNGYRIGYAYGASNLKMPLPTLRGSIIGDAPAVFESACKHGVADGLRSLIEKENKQIEKGR
jgi:hypothetical protein